MTDKFFVGLPVDFNSLCYIYPPFVKDVIKEQYFQVYVKLLTLSQEELEDELVEQQQNLEGLLTPFEYLLNIIYNNPQLGLIIKQAFYFFIHENVTFLPEGKCIIIGDIIDTKSIDNLRILHEVDYFDFQNKIRLACNLKPVEPPNPDEDPRIKRMRAKARYRDKIKMKKNGLKFDTLLTAICCMGIGLNPLNIGDITYFAADKLINMYQQKEKYQIDIRSLLAGADAKKVKPQYWINDLDK